MLSLITKEISDHLKFSESEWMRSFVLRETPNPRAGDAAIPLFAARKTASLSPPEAAIALTERLKSLSLVARTELAGPYLNLFLDRSASAGSLLNIYLKGSLFEQALRAKNAPLVLLEHTSINPNASPHVGRARNALIGDFLRRALELAGHPVDVHYYVNDIGKQIAFLVIACRRKPGMAFSDLLEAYVAINSEAEANPAFEQQAFELIKQFEEGDEKIRTEFRSVVSLCINGQRSILESLGIRYDHFDWESDFLNSTYLAEATRLLEESGATFIDDQNRLVIDMQKLGWKPEEGRYVVLRRANGSSMYVLRDIAYNCYKASLNRPISYVILGEDHKLYMSQLQLIMKTIGRSAPTPLYYSYVLLSDGKMSTRKGTVVLLTEFLREATERALNRVKTSNPNLPKDEAQAIARVVGIGAVKFGILKCAPASNVIFDWESALTFEGDSAPYLQYACARINAILDRAGEIPCSSPHWSGDVSDFEWELVKSLASVPDAVNLSLERCNPGILCEAAILVARRFSRFYHECPVLNADEPSRTNRLLLSKATLSALTNLLYILGIEVPDRM